MLRDMRILLRLMRFLLVVSVQTVTWAALVVDGLTRVLIRLTLLLIKAAEAVARKQSTL